MRKVLWLSVLALVAVILPSVVRAAQNEKKNDEVTVTAVLEPAR